MAKIGVSFKINLNEIDMARVFQGKKGQYLDTTVFIDLDQLDQYGNSGMITQDVTKDEKQQGVKGNILGNCKVFWTEGGQAPQQQNQAQSGFQQAPQQGAQQAPSGQGFQQAPTQQSAPNQQGWGQAPQQQAQPVSQPPQASVEFCDEIPF